MAKATFTRPPEAAVVKSPYRQLTYQQQPIPDFAAARINLPEPVLPDHPEWVEMYWRAWEMVWSNLRQPTAANGFIVNYLDATISDYAYMWDAAFMVQFGWYGRRSFNFMGTLDNFYAKQHADGFICREINIHDGHDFFSPFDPNSTGPNVMAWAEWRYFRVTGDDSRLSAVFWSLLALHRWMRSYRTWPNGLYWATGLSSGMANQPRVPDSMFHHRHWSWIDANMQAALNCLVLGKMAATLEAEEAVQELATERMRLTQQINDLMWNSELAFYQDIDTNGRFSRIKSICAYWGLLDKELVPEKRRTPFIQHLRDSWAFNLPHRIPTLSADSEGYNSQTGNYWRGAVWPATNFMVLKGLRTHGQDSLAYAVARNHVENVTEVFQETGTFWENYAPETAAPGDPAKSDTVGWSGLTPIAILLEDVIGLSVDWPLRRVEWDRRLEEEGAYGVQNYPLGEDGRLDIIGDAETITLTTDAPFTLTVHFEGQTLQTAVPSGTTEIDLT